MSEIPPHIEAENSKFAALIAQCYRLDPDIKYLKELLELLPKCKPQTQAMILAQAARITLDYTKLRADVEAWGDINRRILGLDQKASTQVNINLTSLPLEALQAKIEAALTSPDKLVEAQTSPSLPDTYVEAPDLTESQGSQPEGTKGQLGQRVGVNAYVGTAAQLKFLDHWAFLGFSQSVHQRHFNGEVLARSHADYKYVINGKHLICNIPEKFKRAKYNLDTFIKALKFLHLNCADTPVFIYSDNINAACYIAGLHLVRSRQIKADVWSMARNQIIKMVPDFDPDDEVDEWIQSNWEVLITLRF